MKEKVLELIKWLLVLILAGAAFYCVNPRRNYVPPENREPILEKIEINEGSRDY